MYIFIGPRGDVIEATRTIHKMTRGVLFEKWNRLDKPLMRLQHVA